MRSVPKSSKEALPVWKIPEQQAEKYIVRMLRAGFVHKLFSGFVYNIFSLHNFIKYSIKLEDLFIVTDF